jgi:hypothetical protein
MMNSLSEREIESFAVELAELATDIDLNDLEVARAAYPYPGCCICDNRHVELAHLDHDGSNNDSDNLAWLCPTDHHRFDRGLIPLKGLKIFRAHQQRIKGKRTTLYMKDAGIKAAATRAARGIGRATALTVIVEREPNHVLLFSLRVRLRRIFREAVRARQVRNGLMVAMLAMHPIRLKNFAALEIGRSLVEIKNSWWIVLSASDTKENRPDERRVDDLLQPALDRYLRKYRPVLTGADQSAANALWLSSNDGAPMSYAGVERVITETTRATVGVAVSPHLFRTSIASSADEIRTICDAVIILTSRSKHFQFA